MLPKTGSTATGCCLGRQIKIVVVLQPGMIESFLCGGPLQGIYGQQVLQEFQTACICLRNTMAKASVLWPQNFISFLHPVPTSTSGKLPHHQNLILWRATQI